MEASRLGVLNLQRILDNLVEWTAEEGKDWAQLQELYGQVGSQFPPLHGTQSRPAITFS